MKSRQGPPHVEPNKAVELLERFELLSGAAAHFQISGIPETWKFGLIGSETVTLSRFRSPGQVHNPRPGPNEQSACLARASKVYRSVSVPGKRLELLEQLERLEQPPLVERLEPLEQASLRCVQSDGGPQSAGQTENSFRQSQTILRDLKHHSLPIRRFERLERSAAVEPFDRLRADLERAAVIGERPNRVLDLHLPVQPLFAKGVTSSTRCGLKFSI